MENNEPLMNTVFKFQFREEDKKKSSTFRELKGIKEGLLLEAERLKGKRVCWRNDNWATSLIIQFGSMKEELHSLAFRKSDRIEGRMVVKRDGTDQVL